VNCFRCGSAVPETSRFCGRCGALVSDPNVGTVIVESHEGGLLQRVRAVLAGEFDVDAELARGGMGVVFRGRETELGRPVAIKVLSPELGITARAAERFKREAKMVGGLEHPNIVPVYRVGQVADILFIAMKYIEGRSLGQILQMQGALPVPVVVYVMRAVARALTYAHDREIVHRDVKGDNILVDADGRVLVSDFGVALRASDVTLTIDGTVIGTPAYMSPEQCAGKRAEPQSDQYSLGIVAFQMLSGRVPFDSETLAGYLQHHLFTPTPDLGSTRDDVPSSLIAVVTRALAKNPAERFGSTREMLEAIEAIPFPESDRRQSEDLLRRLAKGDGVDKVITRDFPRQPDARTAALSVVGRGGIRPYRRMLAAAATALTLVVGMGVVVVTRRGVAPAAPRDTVPAAATPLPPAADAAVRPAVPIPVARVATGKLRIATVPSTAEILVDGRRVGIGAVIDEPVAVGQRRIRVRATGYVAYDTIIDVRPDAVVNLRRVALRDARP
jgi:predicted Ser/Thr protein kinase